MIRKYLIITSLAIVSVSLLNSCSRVRNSLGLDKEAPDEFTVITRAPLEMPNELILPPPILGAQRPQEKAPIDQAREILLGNNKTPSKNKISELETTLLQNAKTDNIDPNIREKVNYETSKLRDRNKPVAEKLLNISGNNKTPSATIVDAKKELERIQKIMEEGQIVTGDGSPVIEE